ncbi:hypothetical protein M8J75_009093 [Diaphorina citri]|nr:hypothetical protein M8J75_009093 [Diaphorina citri]
MMDKVVWQDGEKAKSVPFTEWFNTKSVPFTEWFNTKSVPFTEWFSSKSESINDQTRKLDEAQDFRMMDKVV